MQSDNPVGEIKSKSDNNTPQSVDEILEEVSSLRAEVATVNDALNNALDLLDEARVERDDLADELTWFKNEWASANAEVGRLGAELAKYKGDDRHIIEFRADGWTIMHPLACRPDLFACPLNRIGEDLAGPPFQGLGRYYCHLDDDVLVIDEGAPDA